MPGVGPQQGLPRALFRNPCGVGRDSKDLFLAKLRGRNRIECIKVNIALLTDKRVGNTRFDWS